jgi:hypothetical protein
MSVNFNVYLMMTACGRNRLYNTVIVKVVLFVVWRLFIDILPQMKTTALRDTAPCILVKADPGLRHT